MMEGFAAEHKSRRFPKYHVHRFHGEQKLRCIGDGNQRQASGGHSMRVLERGTDSAGVAQVVVVSIVDGMILYWAQVVVLSTQCSHAKRRLTLDTIVCTEHPSATISTPSKLRSSLGSRNHHSRQTPPELPDDQKHHISQDREIQ